MAKVRVPLYGSPQKSVAIEGDATDGATVGRNLFWGNGDPVLELEIRNPPDTGDEFPSTYWRLVLEIPPNVVALAETAGAGIYVVTGPGTSATRALEVGDQLAVLNPAGLGGNPKVSRTTITHNQPGAAATWTINHNLGRHVNVEVYTVGGVRMIAEVIQSSLNQVLVLFDLATAGYAIIE